MTAPTQRPASHSEGRKRAQEKAASVATPAEPDADERETPEQAAERIYNHGGYHGSWADVEDAMRAFIHGARWATSRTPDAHLAAAKAEGVLAEVAAERERQDAKWGEQNHPDGTTTMREKYAAEAKAACDIAFKHGRGSWLCILREEFAEASAEEDPGALRAELIQVAAVAVAWIEAIDRRARAARLREQGGGHD